MDLIKKNMEYWRKENEKNSEIQGGCTRRENDVGAFDKITAFQEGEGRD